MTSEPDEADREFATTVVGDELDERELYVLTWIAGGATGDQIVAEYNALAAVSGARLISRTLVTFLLRRTRIKLGRRAGVPGGMAFNAAHAVGLAYRLGILATDDEAGEES